MQPAADVAEEAREKPDHEAGHAGHLDQEAEEDEERDRQEDEVRHAGIDPRDQHRDRDMRGEREIAVGRDAEGEGDRDAGEHRERHDAEKEDDQVGAPEAREIGPRQHEQGRGSEHGCGRRQHRRARQAQGLHQGEEDHERRCRRAGRPPATPTRSRASPW